MHYIDRHLLEYSTFCKLIVDLLIILIIIAINSFSLYEITIPIFILLKYQLITFNYIVSYSLIACNKLVYIIYILYFIPRYNQNSVLQI